MDRSMRHLVKRVGEHLLRLAADGHKVRAQPRLGAREGRRVGAWVGARVVPHRRADQHDGLGEVEPLLVAEPFHLSVVDQRQPIVLLEVQHVAAAPSQQHAVRHEQTVSSSRLDEPRRICESSSEA